VRPEARRAEHASRTRPRCRPRPHRRSLPEERFDRLTRLAAGLLEAPISLVTLVDRDRQWFKSKVGTLLEETPRDVAFCAHAILGPEPMIVPDALEDERFADNPIVAGPPHVRFYAGCPLLLSLSVDGRVDLAPADPLDARVAAAFAAHQRRMTTGGRLLGPAAVAAAVEGFRRAAIIVVARGAGHHRCGDDRAADETERCHAGTDGSGCVSLPDA